MLRRRELEQLSPVAILHAEVSQYYAEIGALPRYNAGPAWKDPSESNGHDGANMTEAQIREHQNKVSRHRETVSCHTSPSSVPR